MLNDYIIKNTKNNGILYFKEVSTDTAKKIIIENHYSKTWNQSMGLINVGVFRDNKLYGVASFGTLMNPGSWKNITDNKESLIELNRLWIDDILKRNAESILISSSFKIIKKRYSNIKHIQSFADGRLGCGTIYKATNFKYTGYEKTKFFVTNTDDFYHKVILENTKRPISFLGKNRLFLDKKLKACFVKTYRYIYDLYKEYPNKLDSLPYPPYDKGIEYIENYQHSLPILCRLSLMYHKIGDITYSNKCISLLRSYGYSDKEISIEIKNQKENKSYKWFCDKYLKRLNNNNLWEYNDDMINKQLQNFSELF